MRAHEINAGAAELIGAPILWSSVKGILSAHTIGGDHDFGESTAAVTSYLLDFEANRVS